jgi:integrase
LHHRNTTRKGVEMKSKDYPRDIKRGSAVVKIYRKKERGVIRFSVVHFADGKRKFQTFTDEKVAATEAGTIADKLARQDHEGAKLTGADRSNLVAAERALIDCGASLLTAATIYAEAFKILGTDRIIEAARFLAAHSNEGRPELTVADAVAMFEAAKAGKSAKYRKDLRLMLGGLTAAFQCRLAAVSTSDLTTYLAAKKFGAVARNNHTRVIKAFFTYAKEQGWLTPSLPTAADALRQEETTIEKVSTFTPGEVAQLLAHADPDFVPWLALIAFGGLRHEEIAKGLAWENIDLAKGVVHVPGEIAKTKQWRDIEMPPNLRAWLAPFRAATGPVFAQDPDFRIGKTCAAAKVEWQRNALRHSFGSYRMAAVKNAGQVALEMGNSAGIVMKHYRGRVSKEEAKAYWNIKPGTPANVVQMAEGRAA